MLTLEPFYNTVKKPKKTPGHADEGDTATHAHGGCIKKMLLISNYRYVGVMVASLLGFLISHDQVV